MSDNKDIQHAWDFVENTGISIFLTGKAGTGKTTFLKNLKKNSRKSMIVVAPTGVAAINAQGVTIHSFFQLPPSPYIPGMQMKDRFDFAKEKRNIIRTLDLLVIDEISMVRSDLLDAIDMVLRKYRNHSKPFGGVQLLMIGDLQQLTPVVTPEDEEILRGHYQTPYFFGSKALAQTPYVTIELTHVYRQQDESFISILNNIRDGHPTADDLQCLNAHCNPSFCPKAEEGYIRLTTHNNQADSQNQRELASLNTPMMTFDAQTKGTFPEINYPTSASLTLREGAQVMFVKNDTSGSHLYYNGKIGVVTHLSNQAIYVKCAGDEEEIEVKPETWENVKYVLNDKTKEIEPEVQGTFVQYPLRLAWAITIHKSQGLTFERAIIDAQLSFASGQVYVALSRCKSLEGLVLSSPITQQSIIRDNSVGDYIGQQHAAAQRSIEVLPQLKDEYHRQLLMELFTFTDILSFEDRLMRIVIDNFHRYPTACQMHRIACQQMTTKIGDVAQKWTSVIARTPIETLKSEAFGERVQRSAEYFKNELVRIIGMAVEQAKCLDTKDKVLKKRLATVLGELEQTYNAKRLLLADIESDGFSQQAYLSSKAEAIISALSGKTVKAKKARVRKEKTDDAPVEKGETLAGKEPKAKKEDTRQTTLKMYLSGMSVEEIAQERGLTLSTIMGHIARFVTSGDVDPRPLLSIEKRNTVYNAIRALGNNQPKSVIKSACPDHITYGDIEIAMAEYKKA